MASLAYHVQGLPAELFDEIKELTFTVDGDEIVEITKDYKPPPQLQVNRAIRKTFAREYYDSKTFFITRETEKLSAKWLESLSPEIAEPSKNLLFNFKPVAHDPDPSRQPGNFNSQTVPVKPKTERLMTLHGYRVWIQLEGLGREDCEYWTTTLHVGFLLRRAEAQWEPAPWHRSQAWTMRQDMKVLSFQG